eukprot:3391024-Heterocapsa_arctica.AAC.1
MKSTLPRREDQTPWPARDLPLQPGHPPAHSAKRQTKAGAELNTRACSSAKQRPGPTPPKYGKP